MKWTISAPKLESIIVCLIGAEAQCYCRKRIAILYTPTIVERTGKTWMVVGTPGALPISTLSCKHSQCNELDGIAAASWAPRSTSVLPIWSASNQTLLIPCWSKAWKRRVPILENTTHHWKGRCNLVLPNLVSWKCARISRWLIKKRKRFN